MTAIDFVPIEQLKAERDRLRAELQAVDRRYLAEGVPMPVFKKYQVPAPLEFCKRGHRRTEGTTGWHMIDGRLARYCLVCKEAAEYATRRTHTTRLFTGVTA